tara:strand:+ start:4711 stop:5271 length:561 start_codon:yes stop_codon:yes gene_type:complete
LLYLIRHAESVCNLLQSSTGSVLDELSFDGRKECFKLREVAKELKQKFNLKIVSSTAARSLETGVILFGKDLKLDCAWLETNGGYLQDIPEKYVDDFFKLKNNIERKYPNGESNTFMQERVIRSLKKYLDLINNQNIAIITHLGPILAVAKYLGYTIPNVKNLDGIVITYIDKTYKLTTHKKLIHS